MRLLRPILGFVIAPAVVPLAMDTAEMLVLPPEDISLFFALRFYAPFAYGVALFVGVPLYLYLTWRGLRRWWHYALGGAVLGSLPSVIALPPVGGWSLVQLFMMVGAPMGLIAASSFWVIAIWQPGHGDMGSNNALERTRD